MFQIIMYGKPVHGMKDEIDVYWDDYHDDDLELVMKAHKMLSQIFCHNWDSISNYEHALHWASKLRVFWFVKNEIINHIFEKDKNSGKQHDSVYNLNMSYKIIDDRVTKFSIFGGSYCMQNCEWAAIIFFEYVCTFVWHG